MPKSNSIGSLSHPVWVRGLKHLHVAISLYKVVVAPRVGAWIETLHMEPNLLHKTMSHPVWVRGLKPALVALAKDKEVSHPVWVRGLKLIGAI